MDVQWLPSVNLTNSGRPLLQSNEIERTTLSAVDLECEENPNFTPFKSGTLILSTHRMIWINQSGDAGVCIPLSWVIDIIYLNKSIRKIFSSPRFKIVVNNSGTRWNFTKVIMVLRGKTDPDFFYSRSWEVLRCRSWEVSETSSSENQSFDVTDGGSRGRNGERVMSASMVGVSGILRKEQEMRENTDKSVQEAFQDLKALMNKAKDMVVLAERMRQKLLSGSSTQAESSNGDDAGSKEEMQNWLLSVGIVSPVTKESAGALYHQQLSRQLADFVEKPLKMSGGMMTLIDIYCIFNRARGTELISPEDLVKACYIWEKLDVPVMLRKFDSGVVVIQNKTHSDEEVFTRIRSLVLKPDALRVGINPSDAARTLGIAPALAKEHLLTAEGRGLLCRDISSEGFHFYINLFREIDPSNNCSAEHGLYKSWISANSSV